MSETLAWIPEPDMKREIDFEVFYNNNNTTFELLYLQTGKIKIESVL